MGTLDLYVDGAHAGRFASYQAIEHYLAWVVGTIPSPLERRVTPEPWFDTELEERYTWLVDMRERSVERAERAAAKNARRARRAADLSDDDARYLRQLEREPGLFESWLGRRLGPAF